MMRWLYLVGGGKCQNGCQFPENKPCRVFNRFPGKHKSTDLSICLVDCGVCLEKPLEENLLSCPSKREAVEIILYAIFNDL